MNINKVEYCNLIYIKIIVKINNLYTNFLFEYQS